MQLIAQTQQVIAKSANPLLVKVGNVITEIMQSSVVKLKPENISDVAHFVIKLGDMNAEYVREHAQKVNPKELTASTAWFGHLSRTIPQEYPLVKATTVHVHYDGDEVSTQSRPTPDIARSIKDTMLAALVRDVDKLKGCEKLLADNRKDVEGHFMKALGNNKAKGLLHMFETNVVRMLFGMSLHQQFNLIDKAPSIQRHPSHSTVNRLECVAHNMERT